MKECEHQAKQQQNVQIKEIQTVVAQQKQNMKAPGSTTTASSFSSSSDCLAKSSSPSGSRRFSSSVTSFNPYSSSDYIKSTSSDFHAPSTDPIKTFSTTSYDVQSTTSATPNLTTVSTFSCSPSPPPLNLTPISNCSATIASNTQRGRSSSPSQYNSSEELAMIFGIEEKSKAKQMQNNSESATDISVNDLSSANSATAKNSCQQQQTQSSQQESATKPQSRKLPKRYQGHHPHFHHHTAPAYYTDLHLKIHTPEAKDSVNENYRSVYQTPSKLIKDEHQFPKTKTATLPAPLPLNPREKLPNEAGCLENQGSFFRGGTSYSDQRQSNCKDPCMPSKEKFPKPTKGNSSSPSDFIVNDYNSNLPLAAPVQSADGSVVFASTNFKHCHTVENKSPIQNIPGRSRNTQRFANRKRAVRVRSESRPISALYDIICKEKGLDIATTTTSDEESSDSHTHNDEKSQSNHNGRPRKSHSRSVSRQAKSSMASSTNSNMSGCLENNSTGGDRKQLKTALPQQHNDKHATNSIFINDLSDDNDDKIYRLEGGGLSKNFLMSNLHTQGNLWKELQHSKSSSLPPGLLELEKLNQRSDSYHNSHDPFSKISNRENNKKVSLDSNSDSKSLLSSKANHTFASAAQQTTLSNPPLSSNITLSVEHIHMHLSIKSLNDQPPTGTGITNPTTTSNQSQLQDQLKQHQPKADRNLRKYRRVRDEKPRRHTDGAIKLFSPTKNDLDGDGLLLAKDHHQNLDGDVHSGDDDDDQHHHISQYHDLNGAGHDFHTSSSNDAAYAKRYITRSQRIQQQQTNNPRSSPSVASNPDLNTTLKQELNPSTNSETTTSTTTTKVESNGQTTETNSEDKEEPQQEMTNNSGKNSKTTATATATKNNKELKFKIPLKKEVASACAPAAAVPDALCSSTSDKKKDEEKLQHQRFTSPTSPKPKHYSQHNRRASPSSNNLDNMKLATSSSETERNHKMSSDNSSPTHQGNKRFVPSVSISMKQNLSETQCTASRPNAISPRSPKQQLQISNTEYTIKNSASSKVKTITNNDDDDFLEINDLPVSSLNNNETSVAIRPRCSTMITDENTSKISFSNSEQNNSELSPVNTSRSSNRSPRRGEERDKSSKRKSNLNRSLNEEATLDGDDSAMRRRRRREMGMSRPLVPNDDAALKALLSPHKSLMPSPHKPAIRNDLSYHMEMARKGLDLATTSDRRRAQTASPRNQKENTSPKSSIPISRIGKRCEPVTMGELRKERSSEVNRKLNERTRTGLEEIMKIVENVSDSSPNPSNPITDLTQTMKRLRASQESEKEADDVNLLCTNSQEQRRPSPIKHATFFQEERIYYEPDPLEHIDTHNGDGEHLNVSILRSLRMLKSKSIERETSAYEPAVLSPILRRKSTDCPSTLLPQGTIASATPNHIVSILKKKDHLSTGESSSASSNASPVTFSSSVMDTPSKQKRAGILKKRSSLDESRYYSRSHSPDERSILIKSARRNSLEEVANGSSSASSAQGVAGRHGILKQSSYDSCKSEGCPSANREPHQPHSILKKKDSTSTPSDGGDHAPKHVSISQAVILAAAELSAANGTGDKFSNDDINYTPNNEELDIKPILKLDYSGGDESVKPPKPILKKKSSGDSDEQEIKPILKTSRKSSREEFEFGTYSDCEGQQEPQVKPILKTDSPSKRLSLGDADSSQTYQEGSQREMLLKRRTRSLERHDQAPVIDLAAALNAIATSQALPSELVSSLTISTASSNISVSERIKSVEKFLANQSGLRSSPTENPLTTTSFTSVVNTPCDSNSLSNVAGGVKVLKPSVIRRDLYKDRYKTQPVTSDEKNFFKNDVSSLNDNLPSGSDFNPAQSLEGLGFANLSSHGYQSSTAAPSAFTLTRSFTQPLSSTGNSQTQPTSSLRLGVPVPLPRKSPIRSSLPCSQDIANLSASFTSDSSFSCQNNSENVFNMSSLEQDVSMAENQEPKTFLNKDPCETSETSAGVVRTNSVKARANMFQQMQESTKKVAALNRDERTSPKRVPRRLSPSPAFTDEPKTPNNPDDEIASSHTKQTLAPNETSRGIVKSKSGCVSFMPMDLSNELKNRLKSSKHATVSNLGKSATTANVSAANSKAQHDDAVSLVRNLVNLGKPSAQLRDPLKIEPDIASASEGESSGGREISEIIKNSAVARRRKFNEG